jgi:hypothetical protein
MKANRKLKKAAKGYVALEKAKQLVKYDLKTLHELVDKQSRIETGAVEFDGDWPCVVIRGDHAMWYTQILRWTIDQCEEHKLSVDLINLEGLCNLLGSSNASLVDEHPENCQRLKSFTECERKIKVQV